jgi:tetratricopeptide (TPR) repeat protein
MENNARFDQSEMALAAYEAWMALFECEVTLEATKEVMHEMALEQYNQLLAVQIDARRIKVYEYDRQAILRGGVDQAWLDLDEADLDMANTYHKIAGVNDALCKYELAVFHALKCLDIQIKVLGAINLDVANTYHMIAALYSVQKKGELSLEMYGKCLAIRIAVLGENHWRVLDTNHCINIVRAIDKCYKACD